MASISPSIHSSCYLKSAFLGERSGNRCTRSPVVRVGFTRKQVECKESRIGKRPIEVPSNVTIILEGQDLKVKGPLGELSRAYPREVKVKREESGTLKVSKAVDTRKANQMHGLFSIIQKGGSCFYPETNISHASVVMNLYYQSKGMNPWNCYFSFSGITIITDPSYRDCKYV